MTSTKIAARITGRSRALLLGFLAIMLAVPLMTVGSNEAAANCYKPNCWGAIAINTSTGRWGYVYNYPTARSATAGANRKCNYRCNRRLTFRNSCGAYAVARNGGWGWARRYTGGAARARALYECRLRNRGQGCRVRVWACTSR